MTEFSNIHRDKVQGHISREEYWEISRSRFENLEELALFYRSSNITIEISDGTAWVIYRIIKNNEIIYMKLDSQDTRTVPFLLLAEKEYERYQCQIMHKLFEVSNNFSDIGANIGFYSLYATKVAQTLSAIAFEPNSKARTLLERNISKNELKTRVKVSPVALGSANQKNQTMYIPKFTGSGGGSFQKLHPDEENSIIDNIEVMKLDTFAELNRYEVDIMKIDVEGYEMSVIEGAMDVIGTLRPTIVIELLRKWMKPFGYSPQDVLQLLSDLGYVCFEIGNDNLSKIQIINKSTLGNNFVFVHSQNGPHLQVLQKFMS
jgi:FkbM family methyltransferase